MNAARLLKKYRDRYCTFNDDIQGTASVAVAGLFAAMRLTKKKLKENIYMFLGAGSVSIGNMRLKQIVGKDFFFVNISNSNRRDD